MKQPERFRNAFILIGIILVFAVITSTVDAQNSISRGSRFTITITGLPNTAYYVWLTGTWSMSGLPGDQPPIISDGANVQKDPVDGPFAIGSYPSDRGTIIDDVAPSTPGFSDTNYYALVTTDSTGYAVVEFRTSSNTGTRNFPVKVENPTSTSSNLQFHLGLFPRTTPPLTATPTKFITSPITPLPTPTPTPTPTPEPTTLPPTSVPTTIPTPMVGLPFWISVAAFVAIILVMKKI